MENIQTPNDELYKQIFEKMQLANVEELVINNTIVFDTDNKYYRVRKLTHGEKKEAYKYRVEKMVELLGAKDEKGKFKFKNEKDLILLYQERGIDIGKLNSEIESTTKEIEKLENKLGEVLTKNPSDEELVAHKEKIEIFNAKRNKAAFKKAQLLEYSVESQVLVEFYEYITYLVAETKEGDQWVKLWKNYSEFEKADDKLTELFIKYTSLIIDIDG